MSSNDEVIASAMREACEPAGVGRLFAHLGYRLVEPPTGVPFDGFERVAEGAARSCGGDRHVASGSGIAVVWLAAGESSNGSRPARLRSLLAGSVRPVLLTWHDGRRLGLATTGIDGQPRSVALSTGAPRGAEVETLLELRAKDEGAIAALARHARALDRSGLTRRFFRDFRAQRDAVSAAWTGISPTAGADRDQLALLFLCRLVFLYFLQKQGHLLGRRDYLVDLLRSATTGPSGPTGAESGPARAESGPQAAGVFRCALLPLFFGVLNTPAAARDANARALGELPYLNGGLFERHALERAHPNLDLADRVVVDVFEKLLERYRFTAREATGHATGSAGIQPEMLGRMFEDLMASNRRQATGTFYTPAAVVDRIVRRALQGYLAGRPGMDWRAAGMLLRESRPGYSRGGTAVSAPDRAAALGALRDVRVLDPACGSGAFVLGALERLSRLRRSLGEAADEDQIRRELATNALHGVDVEPDAALLCALRLWLALTPNADADAGAAVRPLPNLDHRIRQGDALLDPMDLAGRGDSAAEAWRAAAYDPGVRRSRRLMSAIVRRYGAAPARERSALRARLARCELRLARRWIEGALTRLEARARQLHSRARARDLFGGRDPDRRTLRAEAKRIHEARSELRRLARRLRDDAAVPFFSFDIHFAGAADGFDLVLSNPPWVRTHAWPKAFASMVRSRYRVCGGTSWHPGATSSDACRGRGTGGQVDLSLLFVERGFELLRPGGVLGLLVPTKSFRSLSAAAARALVLERSRLLAVEDHSLNHRSVFRADAFAGALVARREDAAGGTVRVTMTHRASRPLRFGVAPKHLPLEPDDARSPWVIAPPAVRSAMRTMQTRGLSLARHADLHARRGAMTGANELLLFRRAERKLGDAVVAWPAADQPAGSILLHVADLCPVIRGAGIRPFRHRTDGWIAWSHDDEAAVPRAPSARLARHLAPLQKQLRARAGWRPGLPDAVLFRLDETMLRPRVAWRDIACDLEVARLPRRTRSLGAERPLVALNTVYFIPVPDERIALALVALLSSLPCRVFARAIAERAKDARFRFFAWTVGAVPLPDRWREKRNVERLAELGERGHAVGATEGGIPHVLRAEIDDVVSALFGLSRREMAALHRFDAWLRGAASTTTRKEGS